MARINDIRMLAETHAQEIARSPRDWMGYLDTASRLYRYPFRDALLIHAQRPNATACAELELWNNRMMRWVNRGAKGIALLDNTTPRERLRYVFDVSDTHPVRGAREVFLWQMEPAYHEEVLDHLIDTYGLEEIDMVSVEDALYAVAQMQAEENLEEAIYGLTEEAEGTFLEQLDEGTIRTEFRQLLTDSLYYTLARRCELEPMEFLSEEDFTRITDYNRLSVLMFLGNSTSELAEPVLRDIGRTVGKIYRGNLAAQLENSTINMYNTNRRFNALKRESVVGEEIAQGSVK